MPSTRISLETANINSGSKVFLNAASFTFGWKNNLDVPPIEGKNDLADANFGGIENPVIKLRGAIDVDSIGVEPTTGSLQLTQQLLTDFALERSGSLVLTIITGSSQIHFGGRPSNGYAVGSTLGSTLGLVVDSFDFSIDSTTNNGHLWRYNINLREV